MITRKNKKVFNQHFSCVSCPYDASFHVCFFLPPLCFLFCLKVVVSIASAVTSVVIGVSVVTSTSVTSSIGTAIVTSSSSGFVSGSVFLTKILSFITPVSFPNIVFVVSATDVRFIEKD